MNRWASNSGLLFLSFLMAVGIVWIKGQERLDQRTLSGIPVNIQNLPDNLVLPDPWTSPTVSVTLQGPRNVLDLMRVGQLGFLVPFSQEMMPDIGASQNVLLTPNMFRTSLMDRDDSARISVDEESITPRQVSIFVLPWEITGERPSYEHLIGENNDSVVVPLFRVQKEVPIVVPTQGTPQGKQEMKIGVDPEKILITGKREAVERIRSVSTTILDLGFVMPDTPPQYMALPDLEQFSVEPVDKTIRGVTVTVEFSKKGL